MSRSVRAKINGAMLAWARKEVGFDETELAKSLKKTAEDILQWESGQAFPTLRQARELAKRCDQPFASFYLPEPPKQTTQKLEDFRRLPEVMGNTLSNRLRLEIRRSSERREIEIELYEALGEPVPSFQIEVSSKGSAEETAARLRESLGMSIEVQKAWRDNRKAFNALRGLVTSRGIEVFQAKGIKVSEMRGFSINQRPLPVIVVNRQDSYAGRIFTLVHELVHVINDVPSLCDLDESEAHYQKTLGVEVFCNAVAGNLLVPKEDLLAQESVSSHRNVIWNNGVIEDLAARYSVSREVILRRLLDLGKTSRRFYEEKVQEYLEELRTRRKKKGRPSPSVDALSQLGPNFVGLVMNAYASEAITLNDASDYIGLKVGRLENLISVEHR